MRSKREAVITLASVLLVAGTAWESSAADGGAGTDAGASGGAAGATPTGGTAGAAATAGTGGATGGASTGGGSADLDCYGNNCSTTSGGFCCAAGFVEPSGCAGGAGTAKCQAPGGPACAHGETTIRCDGPEDCPGMVCCGTFQECSPTSGGYGVNRLYLDVSCRPAAECASNNTAVVCDPDAPNACPIGEICFPGSPSLPGWACRPCKTAFPSGGFGDAPDGAPCDDHNPATVDYCQKGVCVGTEMPQGTGGTPGQAVPMPPTRWKASGADSGCAHATTSAPRRHAALVLLLALLARSARRSVRREPRAR